MARKKSKEEWKVYGNVFDQFTERNIFRLSAQGYFGELQNAYALGKEANVFLADGKDDDTVVVKIYRLENCNFNKMYQYLLQDERFADLKGQRRKIIFSWVQREYRNLLKAREFIRVPTPLAIKDNILVLEMIGEDGQPAPQLKDSEIKNPREFLDLVINTIIALGRGGLVHGDLSGFNILNCDDEPVFIDFSQSTTTKSDGWKELLQRDLVNVATFFKKQGIEEDAEKLYVEVLKEIEKEED